MKRKAAPTDELARLQQELQEATALATTLTKERNEAKSWSETLENELRLWKKVLPPSKHFRDNMMKMLPDSLWKHIFSFHDFSIPVAIRTKNITDAERQQIWRWNSVHRSVEYELRLQCKLFHRLLPIPTFVTVAGDEFGPWNRRTLNEQFRLLNDLTRQLHFFGEENIDADGNITKDGIAISEIRLGPGNFSDFYMQYGNCYNEKNPLNVHGFSFECDHPCTIIGAGQEQTFVVGTIKMTGRLCPPQYENDTRSDYRKHNPKRQKLTLKNLTVFDHGDFMNRDTDTKKRQSSTIFSAVTLEQHSHLLAEDCIFKNSCHGLYASNGALVDALRCQFVNNQQSGVTVHGQSSCWVAQPRTWGPGPEKKEIKKSRCSQGNFTDCSFQQNGTSGICVHASEALVTLHGSLTHLYWNRGDAIRAYASGRVQLYFPQKYNSHHIQDNTSNDTLLEWTTNYPESERNERYTQNIEKILHKENERIQTRVTHETEGYCTVPEDYDTLYHAVLGTKNMGPHDRREIRLGEGTFKTENFDADFVTMQNVTFVGISAEKTKLEHFTFQLRNSNGIVFKKMTLPALDLDSTDQGSTSVHVEDCTFCEDEEDTELNRIRLSSSITLSLSNCSFERFYLHTYYSGSYPKNNTIHATGCKFDKLRNIQLRGEGSIATLIGCTIRECSVHGLHFDERCSSVTIKRCNFVGFRERQNCAVFFENSKEHTQPEQEDNNTNQIIVNITSCNFENYGIAVQLSSPSVDATIAGKKCIELRCLLVFHLFWLIRVFLSFRLFF